jgi:N-methylhydantoinase A
VVTRELSKSYFTPPGSEGASEYVQASDLNAVLGQLEKEARDVLDGQGVTPEELEVQRFVDMRFRFQIHELTVEVPAFPMEATDVDLLLKTFIENYELRFGEGSAFTAAGVEMVTWRVVVTGKLKRPEIKGATGSGSSNGGAPSSTRTQKVYEGEWLDATVYDETALHLGAVIDGPAIVELPDTTIVVGRTQRATVDEQSNVIIETA